jgi:hypothetical protein
MALVGLKYGQRRMPWAEVMAESIDGLFPYPPALVRALMETRESDVPSASTLAGCLRRWELKRQHDYYVEPTSMLPLLFGTAFHLLMQKYARPEDGDAEVQLTGVVDTGLEPPYERLAIQGTPDVSSAGEILDYKTKKFIPQGWTSRPEHRAQANVYNWLRAANGKTPAERWRLVYASQSWLAAESGPMRDVEDTGEWIRTRLRVWAKAKLANALPPPLPRVLDVEKGRPVGECGYCEVREHCLAALQREEA